MGIPESCMTKPIILFIDIPTKLNHLFVPINSSGKLPVTNPYLTNFLSS